jgi:hypothetical protein
MNFATEASKLLTNKYFLYFMVFLAGTNVLGYLVTHKLNAVAFFVLVSFLTFQFSKNMAVVLLVALVSTNFLMANKRMHEGLENQSQSQALSQIENKDSEIANAIPAVQNAKKNEEITAENISASLKSKEPGKVIDTNNTDLNASSEEGPTGAGQKLGGKKPKTNENGSSRLDYAATIEESYKNLDEILGSDSINKLTNDTQQLMTKQKQLFDTMQNMVPVLRGAQDLLANVDVGGLTDSLKSIGGLTGAHKK